MSKYRADTVREHLRNGVLLRNPVLVQAIGLFPVVAVATSMDSALLFTVVSAVILIIMELLTNLVLKHIPQWLRVGFYALLSFAVIVPFVLLTNKYSAGNLSPAASFLPILSVNALISYRCERIAVPSTLKNSFWDAVTTSLGYGAVLLLVGFIRELLGSGSVFGYSIPNFPKLSGLLMPFGGFIILGFMAAGLKWIMSRPFDYAATKTAVDHIREEELEEKEGIRSLFGYSTIAGKLKNHKSVEKTKPAEDNANNVKADKLAEKQAKAERKAAEKAAKIAEKKRIAEQKRAEAERVEREKAARIAEQKREEAERIEREKAARIAEQKREEAERVEREKAARIAEQKREEAERVEREKAARIAEQKREEAERIEREKAARIAEQKRAEAERVEREKAARIAEQKREEAERVEREKAARIAEQKRAEAERIEREKAARIAEQKREEAERIEREKAKEEEKKKPKAKKPGLFSAMLTPKKATAKPAANPVTKPAAKPAYDEDDFDYDAVWAKYKSRQAQRENDNKEEPKQ